MSKGMLGCKLSIFHQNIRSVGENFDNYLVQLSAYANISQMLFCQRFGSMRAGCVMVCINTFPNICEFKRININTADSSMVIFKDLMFILV